MTPFETRFLIVPFGGPCRGSLLSFSGTFDVNRFVVVFVDYFGKGKKDYQSMVG